MSFNPLDQCLDWLAYNSTGSMIEINLAPGSKSSKSSKSSKGGEGGEGKDSKSNILSVTRELDGMEEDLYLFLHTTLDSKGTKVTRSYSATSYDLNAVSQSLLKSLLHACPLAVCHSNAHGTVGNGTHSTHKPTIGKTHEPTGRGIPEPKVKIGMGANDPLSKVRIVELCLWKKGKMVSSLYAAL